METIMSSVSMDVLAVARKTVIGAAFIVVSSSLLTAGVAGSSSIDGKNASQQVALHTRTTNATNAILVDWKMIVRRNVPATTVRDPRGGLVWRACALS